MRIVFMGTPEFAVASLKQLLDDGHDIVAVITATDKPAGRGRKIRYSDVKDFALRHNLKVLQPVNLKDPDFINELKALKPELQVVVAFRMLPKVVWDLPPKGTINLHASLLPEYRGAAPINWAIINGEYKTGVTTFYINEIIDQGSIIDQREVGIDENETAGTLHDKLMISGARLLSKTVEAIEEGNAGSFIQDTSLKYKAAPKIFKEDTHIDFNKPAREVKNFIHGLSPFPAAYSILYDDTKELNVKIYKVKLTDQPAKEPGKVYSDNQNYVNIDCSDYQITVQNWQLAGKKSMFIKEFLNGFKFGNNAKMG